ncbi:hypothetical protein KORDIASMS9_02584 [Kordia sp. SMS9]|uniref:hypothetical protein n=1 Tax=Kordia sp. SMS9 TaxID=2282170 RepID=UPI000E0D6780|nr:hypothetical protein [Kordia sp. SMS9]AXG70345.1 hypothetical protein KORDIASMS9_02584 [Kordia sp. SMS9]
MKKKNLNLLRLKKERISNFTAAVVGGKSVGCDYSRGCLNDTRNCDTKALQDCTVTYAACITEARFCGMF